MDIDPVHKAWGDKELEANEGEQSAFLESGAIADAKDFFAGIGDPHDPPLVASAARAERSSCE